jgi:ribosome-binding protein aMBF1 (putative translation factor)
MNSTNTIEGMMSVTLREWIALGVKLGDIEDIYLATAIATSDKRTNAAATAGLSRSTFYNRLKKTDKLSSPVKVQRRPMTANEELGLIVRGAREKLGVKLDYIACILGYAHASMISDIEHGRKCIPIKRVKDFAAALQISSDDLANAIVKARNNYDESGSESRFQKAC